jgi:membrane-associated HD superfamily phosphohydrolase
LTRLFGAYYTALDYVVIIDAIYTAILDEVAQGSKITPSSRYCPLAQISLIYVIFALVNTIWFVAVVWFFPCGFCCCIRYKKGNKWKEIKRQLCYRPKNIKVVCCSSQDQYQNQQQPVSLRIPCCPPSWNAFKILIYMAIGCTTLSVVYIFIILVSAVLFPISIIVMLIVLIIDYFCSRRCCKCYQDGYFGTVFLTFSIVCLLVIYLPVYMIADNAWPWICFLTENNWSIMRYVLLSFALVISIFPTLYKAISVQANLKLLEKNTPAIRQSQREEEHAIN